MQSNWNPFEISGSLLDNQNRWCTGRCQVSADCNRGCECHNKVCRRVSAKLRRKKKKGRKKKKRLKEKKRLKKKRLKAERLEAERELIIDLPRSKNKGYEYFGNASQYESRNGIIFYTENLISCIAVFVRIYDQDNLKGIVGWHVMGWDFDMNTKQLSEKGKEEREKIIELVSTHYTLSDQVKTTIYAPVKYSEHGYELYDKNTLWQLNLLESEFPSAVITTNLDNKVGIKIPGQYYPVVVDNITERKRERKLEADFDAFLASRASRVSL